MKTPAVWRAPAVVTRTAEEVFIPFTVGGGIRAVPIPPEIRSLCE